MKSIVKVAASVFGDVKGILLIDYIHKGQTISDEYYIKLIYEVYNKNYFQKTWLHKIIFHQNNAHLHTSVVAIGKFTKLKYDLLPYPSYLLV